VRLRAEQNAHTCQQDATEDCSTLHHIYPC
jgi:hypothetical protein